MVSVFESIDTCLAPASSAGVTPMAVASLPGLNAGHRSASGGDRAGGAAGREASGVGDSLGNSWYSFPQKSEALRERREHRLWLRSGLQEVLALTRGAGERVHALEACGVPLGTHVLVRGADPVTGAAGIEGLSTCGSALRCPMCASKVAAGRQRELEQVLAWADGEGYSTALVTFTVAHEAAHALKDSWDAVQKAFSACLSGSRWAGESVSAYEDFLLRREAALADRAAFDANRALGIREGRAPRVPELRERRVGLRERFGIVGHSRVVEVTHGVNGWHPHVHWLVISSQHLDTLDALKLQHALFPVYLAALEKQGFSATRVRGVDVRVGESVEVALASYFVKQVDGFEALGLPEVDWGSAKRAARSALARETTQGHTKRGRGASSRVPFQILADFLTDGDMADWDLFREFFDATAGRAFIRFSSGLRAAAGLDADITDESLAAGEGRGTGLVAVPVEVFARLEPSDLAWILRLAEEAPGSLAPMLHAAGIDVDDPEVYVNPWGHEEDSAAG